MRSEAICPETLCGHSIAERPRYYAHQLITDEIMRLEQKYFLDRLRRHNRLMHGWGVVCGAQVCPVEQSKAAGGGYKPWEVVVHPGYILGPYGDEIMLDCERVVDLRTGGVSGVTGEPCVEAPDPWCSEVFTPRHPEAPLYVAVKYKECQSRPVRIQPTGCGCDEAQCEYSRLRDGYEIGVINCCPDSHMPENGNGGAARREVRGNVGDAGGGEEGGPFKGLRMYAPEYGYLTCPPCPPEPWVVLAEVRLGDGGRIMQIDNCSCRRIVLSFGSIMQKCTTELPSIETVIPASATREDKDVQMTIKGKNFKEPLRVDLGLGITVDNRNTTVENGTTIKTTFSVDKNAPHGVRTVMVINSDCSIATLEGEFEVGLNFGGTAAPAESKPRETGPQAGGAAGGGERRPSGASKKKEKS